MENKNTDITCVTNRRELVERLKDLYSMESVARMSYEEDLATFKNFEILDKIRIIKNDEDRHIAMLKELINLLDR